MMAAKGFPHKPELGLCWSMFDTNMYKVCWVIAAKIQHMLYFIQEMQFAGCIPVK